MLYPNRFEQAIGFAEIRTLLHEFCDSPLGHERVDAMQYTSQFAQLQLWHQQVAEYRTILAESTQLPEQEFYDLRESVHYLRIEGTHLEEKTLWELYRSLNTLHQWVAIIRPEQDGEKSPYPALEKITEGVFTFHAATRQIERLLDKYGRLRDEASATLAGIRAELRRAQGSISHTLQRILRSAQEQGVVEKDMNPTLRDGRLVIPVAPAMKRRIKGIVHDESATGKTIYIEPSEVVEANNRIRELENDEKREVIRILKEFSDTLRPYIKELLRAFEMLATLELIRAKSKLAEAIGGITPVLVNKPHIDWIQARHPLLERSLRKQGKSIVPLDLTLHHKQRILLISGPNAGGKSVCLKTAGLLQYMLQCGLPVPMSEHSQAGIFEHLFIDIGDEQSIEDDLSTYSSHLLNMKHMMRHANARTLLLIDEFGSGTEPTIGGAFAEAILARYVQRGAFGVITTHYQNLKHYADHTPQVVNGAMLYDRQNTQALFQLQIGNPGSSFAVEIARKIGIPEEIIADATQKVGQEYVNADKYLLDITRDKRYWEGKRQTIHSQEKQMAQTIEQYEREIVALREKQKTILTQAKEKAKQIIAEANARVENTIREIKEAQAEKERTRQVRQEMDEYVAQLEEDDKQDDAFIERKMQQIRNRQQRQATRKQKKQQAPQVNEAPTATVSHTAPLAVGDTCRIKGQQSVGIVERIDGKKALVTFGAIKTTVPYDRLERAVGKEATPTVTVNFLSRDTQNQIRQKHLDFSQELDVRGMRGDEALQTVSYYMDDVLLTGTRQVRILHGTGNGILRHLIRQYLNTLSFVKNAHDEHVQFGGAGITVVEMK